MQDENMAPSSPKHGETAGPSRSPCKAVKKRPLQTTRTGKISPPCKMESLGLLRSQKKGVTGPAAPKHDEVASPKVPIDDDPAWIEQLLVDFFGEEPTQVDIISTPP